MGFENIN